MNDILYPRQTEHGLCRHRGRRNLSPPPKKDRSVALVTGHGQMSERFHDARFQDIDAFALGDHGRYRCDMTESEVSIFLACGESDQNSTFDSSTEKFWTQGFRRWHLRSTSEKACQTVFESHVDSISPLGGEFGFRQWNICGKSSISA